MILAQARGALRDLSATAGRAVLVAAQAVLLCLCLAMALASLTQATAVLRQARQWDGSRVTMFATYYPAFAPAAAYSDISLDTLLRAQLDGTTAAASVVVTNAEVLEAPGWPVFIGLGSVATTLESYLPALPDAVTAAPYALLGAAVPRDGVGNKVTVGSMTLPVRGTLLPGATYFHPRLASIDLDSSIVILGAYGPLVDGGALGTAFDEVPGNLVLVDASDADIAQVTAAASGNGTVLVPQDLSLRTAGTYTDQVRSAVLYVTFFAVAGAMLLAAGAATAASLIRTRGRDYAIHELCGAPTRALLARVQLYIAAIWLLPACVGVGLGVLATPGMGRLAPALIAAAVAIQLLLTIQPIGALRRRDLPTMLRRDTT